jgi:phenylalanyl-tRNA synthetase beta subunit
VPFWRSPDDINITEDIYEEIARIYGYDKIDAQPLLSPIENAAYTPYVAMTRKLEELLVERFGFVQTETYPWISEKVVRELG